MDRYIVHYVRCPKNTLMNTSHVNMYYVANNRIRRKYFKKNIVHFISSCVLEYL